MFFTSGRLTNGWKSVVFDPDADRDQTNLFFATKQSANVKSESMGRIIDATKTTYQNVHPGTTNENLLVS